MGPQRVHHLAAARLSLHARSVLSRVRCDGIIRLPALSIWPQPLQRYYLPYYLRSETAGIAHSASKYEMLYVSDGETPGRAALEADVQPGTTPQFGGKPLPLTLTPDASVHGTYFLMREAPRNYQNKVIYAWIAHWIYGDVPLYNLFKMQLLLD